jgi:pimeloyl-ACP methyl ester carboxylesterase
MGAGIATNCALRYPDHVEALVLVRPAWMFDSDPSNLLPLLDAAMFCNEKGGVDLFSASQEIQKIRDSVPGAYDSLLGLFQRDQPEHTADVLQHMVGDFPVDPNGRISKPTLIIGNDDDPLHPWEMAEAWHQHIKGSKLVKVPSRYMDGEAHRESVRLEITQFIDTLNL